MTMNFGTFCHKGRFACRWNFRLTCPIDIRKCPFENSRFLKDLEFFFTHVRTRYEKVENNTFYMLGGQVVKFQQISFDVDCPKHAKYIMCFGGEYIFNAISRYIRTGRIEMTKKNCRRWREVYRKWIRLLDYVR